jgi:hypothetical protein
MTEFGQKKRITDAVLQEMIEEAARKPTEEDVAAGESLARVATTRQLIEFHIGIWGRSRDLFLGLRDSAARAGDGVLSSIYGNITTEDQERINLLERQRGRRFGRDKREESVRAAIEGMRRIKNIEGIAPNVQQIHNRRRRTQRN